MNDKSRRESRSREDKIIKLAQELQEAMLHAGMSNVDPTDVARIGERQFWLITEALEKAAALSEKPRPISDVSIPLAEAINEPCKGCGKRPIDFITGE
jgi:hypothetical protein